jgi:pilus assembly protein CpaB
MGKWRPVIPILLAAIIALVGAFVVNHWLKGQAGSKGKQTMGETGQTVVAAIDLPWGSKLTVNDLTTVPFIKDTIPSGYFNNTAALNGRVLLSPIKRHEVILESKLAPLSITTGGVSAVIPSGKRAIAVKGDKVIGLAGLIQPGNHVDILVSITDPQNHTEVTKIVLENILVLAADTKIEKGPKEGETAPVDVYTLEVTPEEGEMLALAATQGRLQFALRNPVDMDVVLTNGANIKDTLTSFYTPGYKKTASQSPSPVHESQVLIINGVQPTTVKYGL